MEAEISHQQITRFSEFVAETTGLHFPPLRFTELQRGVVAMAQELGFEDADTCLEWLMSAPLTQKQIEALAGNLTVGETYFFREPKSLEILTEHILPDLIRARNETERRLRIWSAACCTGEEPYSIAIALRQAIPDCEHLALLATDINPRFLRKASAGVFGNWSFRSAPPWLKGRYFRATHNGQYEIIPEIKRMVRFAPLNLVEDVYPSPTNDTHAMDVIFCRNVLMYFTAAQAQKVIAKLYRAQAEGGWLIVGPSELPQISAAPYVAVNFDGMTVYRKDNSKPPHAKNLSWQEKPRLAADQQDEKASEEPAVVSALPTRSARPEPALPISGNDASDLVKAIPNPYNEAMILYKQGNYAGVVDKLRESLSSGLLEPAAFGLLARSLANQGKLHEAIDCCHQWIAADKLNLGSHYLRAMILLEKGATDEAVQSLRKALYLDPRFVLGYFALGNIARDRGQVTEARKHLHHALELSVPLQPDEVLPESEGVTAGRFTEIVRALIDGEAVT